VEDQEVQEVVGITIAEAVENSSSHGEEEDTTIEEELAIEEEAIIEVAGEASITSEEVVVVEDGISSSHLHIIQGQQVKVLEHLLLGRRIITNINTITTKEAATIIH